MFITFEGGEGAGKSTQIQRLAQALQNASVSVCVTREPGGCPTAEAIRQLVLFPPAPLQAATTTLLMLASRVEHVHHTIAPALREGQWVLCDRFTDSTRAYQSAAHGVSLAMINEFTQALKIPTPDLTFVLDIPVEVAQQRRVARGQPSDVFEQQQADFHGRVRQAFLDIAAADPHHYCVIDASQPIDNVTTAIWQRVQLLIKPTAASAVF